MNKRLLLLCPVFKATLKTGEKIEGLANYTDQTGVEVVITQGPDTGEFRWIERSEIA